MVSSEDAESQLWKPQTSVDWKGAAIQEVVDSSSRCVERTTTSCTKTDSEITQMPHERRLSCSRGSVRGDTNR